jgi:hypothetical protein
MDALIDRRGARVVLALVFAEVLLVRRPNAKHEPRFAQLLRLSGSAAAASWKD